MEGRVMALPAMSLVPCPTRRFPLVGLLALVGGGPQLTLSSPKLKSRCPILFIRWKRKNILLVLSLLHMYVSHKSPRDILLSAFAATKV